MSRKKVDCIYSLIFSHKMIFKCEYYIVKIFLHKWGLNKVENAIAHMLDMYTFSSVQFSGSDVSDSLWHHELQHPRPPCPPPTLGVHPDSCPSSWWCHPALSSCHPLLLLLSIFSSIRVFSNESVLVIRWPKYWSFTFSISPSNEYSGLISFRIDWLVLFAV